MTTVNAYLKSKPPEACVYVSESASTSLIIGAIIAYIITRRHPIIKSSPFSLVHNRTLLPIENQGYPFTKFKRPFPVKILNFRGVKILDYEAAENLDEKLDSCTNLADVFELVKQSVKRFLRKHRAGLMLGLVDLGMRRGYFVGAFHPMGSNIIVMNRTPLKIASQSTDKTTFNAYCFHLLLHEYLHSLGYIHEDDVKQLTQEVCMQALGKAHPATVMAEQGIATYFPKVTYFTEEFPLPESLQVELVKDFDKSSVGYIH